MHRKTIRVLAASHYPSSFVGEMVKHIAKQDVKVKYLTPLRGFVCIPFDEFKNLDVEVIPLEVRGVMTEQGILQKSKFVSSPKFEMMTYVYNAFRQIIREAKEVDILHAHWVLPLGLVASVAGRLLNKPVVISVHGASVYYNPEADFVLPKYFYIRILLKITFHLVHKLFSISKDCTKHLLARGAPQRKIKLVYNGVDKDKFNPSIQGDEVRKGLGIGPSTPLILTVRNLHYRKGLHILIRAMKRVKKEFPEVRLVIIGTGPMEEELKKLVLELHLEDEVTFLGFVPNDELPPYYAASDIFVIPSLDEGFGISAVEAMAMAKPIVSTDAGGLKEVVDDKTAIVVPPGNVKELSDGILKLLKNHTLAKKLGKNGRKKVEEVFNWDRAAHEFIDTYKELL